MAPTVSETLSGLEIGQISPVFSGLHDAAVSAVTSDSGAVRPGVIFVAVRGGTHDGHRFIPEAVEKGALLVIGEERDPGGIGGYLVEGHPLPL